MGDVDNLDDGIEIAVAAGLVGRCSVCLQTWTLAEFDDDDDEGWEEVVAGIRSKNIEGAGGYEDAELIALLKRVLEDAASEKQCEHF